MQLVTLAMLFTSIAQITYWLVDEASYMNQVLDDRLASFARAEAAAQELLDDGHTAAEIQKHFPSLVVTDGMASINHEIVDELTQGRRRRLIRYGSEGTFLLLVLLAGIATLTHTLKQPAELMRRQENFIAAVSHEFKTPIASLKLSAETLLMREIDLTDQRKLADRMIEDAERLESMVTNILEAGTIAEGRLELRPEDVQLEELITGLSRRHANQAQFKGIELEIALEPGLAIRCDRSALVMILDNLLSNATKSVATKNGGTIEIRGWSEDAHVRLDIIDSGQGFHPSEAHKLFEKFYRPGQELRRKTRGSGLGLFVVKTLVDGSAGQVQAHSDGEGHGATFSLWMPPALEVPS